MARLALAAVMLLASAAPARAEYVSEEAYAAASDAGLDPVAVQGASNSTGMQPYEYLYAVGHLKLPAPVWTVWDRLAQCESRGDWSINAYHDGGLQFHPGTWSRYKPTAYPAYAYQASREQQILVGQRVLASEGWAAWPVCSRILRLR